MPTTIILLAVGRVTFLAYQQVAADLVVGRNGELTRLSAGQLSTQLAEYSGLLASLARIADTHRDYPAVRRLVSDPTRIGQSVSSQPVVQQVLGGKVGSGLARDASGRSVVASYAPVPGTSWELVSSESWATLSAASLGYTRFLVVLLVAGVVVPTLVVLVCVGRITRPIRDPIEAARQVAGGNFGQAISARTGDEIELLAEQLNRMSAELQESYGQFERLVADRTRWSSTSAASCRSSE